MARNQPAPLTASTPGIVRRDAVPAPGIVHLGLGNFHRAHQAVYTDAAISAHGGDWGIIGVSSRSSAVTDAMHAQDMTYTVVEISPEGSTFSTPRVHSDAFVAAQNPERVVAEIGAATTRIVSLTVTENGYTYSPATGSLNVADADVQHDLAEAAAPARRSARSSAASSSVPGHTANLSPSSAVTTCPTTATTPGGSSANSPPCCRPPKPPGHLSGSTRT
ncbi:hypothetical protein [Arthrobacter sp. 24S4-2]|uniref:hypothetical protein n=1 Tax=Arthrobacter sp. 24S4-2 TaxID=2575374 RepID=UPI0020C7CF9F|nr:hypothetical protein [Arthrobacter sp. 24S4-2]